MADQLPFRFPDTPQYTAADFLATAANRLARRFLSGGAPWPHGRLVLWGGAGTGKTHLLHLWAERAGARLVPGPGLPGGAGWPAGPLAIDDLDRVPDEAALLHLLNAAAESGHAVLLAARQPPSRLPIRLPDLSSRLRAATAVEIGAPDDSFLPGLLARLLAARQMTMPAALQAWLLTRLPRTPGAVRDAVARLDRAALAEGAPVTRSLARSSLAELLQDGLQDGPAADPEEASPRACGFG